MAKKAKKEAILPHELTADDIWAYRLFLSRFTDEKGHPLEEGHPELLFNRSKSPFGLFYSQRHSFIACRQDSPSQRQLGRKNG